MNEDELVEGTPIEEWPILNRAQVDELRYMNIRTVEQLANVSDTNAQGMMGINMLRQKAQTYLENAKDAALTERLDEQAQMIAELQAKLAEQAEEKPKRRGRPRKEETEE